MEIYLVGGAVRDELLGLDVTEKDWLVVGSTPEEMLQKGFKPVGKDFPVFLHSTTQEEYALARSEKKVAAGYAGFTFQADPDVTLEQDLLRRDLTINAIAKSQDGHLLDPYHGIDDIKNKILRHVSPAFIEDPVRILRIARFAARFPEFSIADKTLQLMKDITTSGELSALVAERVFLELQKTLATIKPSLFFLNLRACNALTIIFPELTLNEQTLKRLDTPVKPIIRFCLLLSANDTDAVKILCQQLKVPKDYKSLAILFNSIDVNVEPSAKNKLDLLLKVDAFRRPERLALFFEFCHVTAPNSPLLQTLTPALEAALTIDIESLLGNAAPADVQQIVYQARLKAIAANNAAH